MSRVDPREVKFAEDWLMDIGAIDRRSRKITWKGVLMSEIPYDPDFAHMISSALISDDYDAARFLLASGSFGDSLNHAYRSELEGVARQFLYGFDRSNELNIKANLLKRYSEDRDGSFASRLVANGIFPAFVEEAQKNYQAARDALNDLLLPAQGEQVPEGVVADLHVFKLRPYLEDCLAFEKFELYEKKEHNLREMVIEGPFYARSVTINYRRILFDIVAMNQPKRHQRRGRR
jgi:HrpA-like RNA helicase